MLGFTQFINQTSATRFKISIVIKSKCHQSMLMLTLTLKMI